MKCPACNSLLVAYNADGFVVDICRDGCSGIWFDKTELERCDQHKEPFPPELLRVRKIAAVAIDRNKQRQCPKCSPNVLSRVVIDPETRFEIDRCDACDGAWLDIGELEAMRRRDAADSALQARLDGYAQQLESQLKSVDSRRRIMSLLKVLLPKRNA